MPKSVATRVLIGGLELSTHSTAANTNITAETEDVTTFQSTGKQTLTLDPTMVLDLAGFFHDPAGGLEYALQDALTNTTDVAFHYDTAGASSVIYYGVDVGTSDFTVNAPIPGVITVTGSFMPAGPNRAYAAGWGTFTDTGAKPGYLAIAGALQNVIVITTDLGGAGVVSFTVEESATGSGGWSSVLIDTTNAVGVETVPATGTGPYYRLVIDDLGGGTPNLTVGVQITPA